MTQDEFKNLKVGDIIVAGDDISRSMEIQDRATFIIVQKNFDGSFIAMKPAHITSYTYVGWDLLKR